MKTVHLVLNAHLDHVWLWPWPRGLDAALNTCRAMCELLDDEPDAVFCRGDGWLYHEIEQVAPQLFARIRAHVEAGRWRPIGACWVQPDRNLPGRRGLEMQLELGRQYFRSRFGLAQRTEWSVDGFGHPASLPATLRRAGLDRYVMMRPQEHEMALPARLFRWRGEPDGPEVLVFRVARAYATFGTELEDHVRASLSELPEGVDHTMCLLGAGDHGGGPTRAQLAWCRSNEAAFEGARLVFSWPDRFFDAVSPLAPTLPLVVGELQPHAVGCYSVHRAVKLAVGRAERLLERAAGAGAPPGELEGAWRDVCFAQFHDVLAGTSVPSAYPQVLDRLGRAAALADSFLERALRRRALALPPSPDERVVLWNASDRPFRGPVVHEQVLLEERRPWSPSWRLLDGEGRALAYQLVRPEAVVAESLMQGLLLRADLAPGEVQVIRIDRSEPPGPSAPGPSAPAAAPSSTRLEAGALSVDLAAGLAAFPTRAVELPRLELLADESDTWSHGLARYGAEARALPSWQAPARIEGGPLRASLARSGRIGRSDLVEETRLVAGEGFVELLIRVEWVERHAVLKLVVRPPSAVLWRLDGIPGGCLRREADCDERPVRAWSLLELEDGCRLGLVCPDAFALDGTKEAARLTLLRAPLLAHHEPEPAAGAARGLHADRGYHLFRLRLLVSEGLDPDELEDQASQLDRPPLAAVTTAGMAG